MPTAADALAALPRLGLIDGPSPLEAAPALGTKLGAPGLRLKRDDLLPALHGGTKLRKLDLVLAEEPYRSATAWQVVGAVGSGQVAAVVDVGRAHGRPVHAHLFRTPLGAHGRENLAWTASFATTLHAYRDRVDLALRSPLLLLGFSSAAGVPVPLGATSVRGMLGCVLGGLELAGQLATAPADAIYVPYGSGGTAAGLAVGLALGGCTAPVRAVAVVERVYAPDLRLFSLVRQAQSALRALGVAPAPVNLQVVRSQLGGGYAHATAASIAAAEALNAAGIAGEPVYTGKALAALAADAAAGRTRAPVFWVTVRRGGLEPRDDWQTRLPPPLRDLAVDGDAPTAPSRRGLLLGLGAAAAVVGAARLTGYPGPAGEVLGAAELAVVRATAEALFPDATAAQLDAVPTRVDRYVLAFPAELRAQVHGLFFAVEQSLPFSVGLDRFTTLSPADRLLALERIAALGPPGLLIARSIRDLVLLGWYQSPEAWADVGYEGPMVDAAPRPTSYDALRAPAGWVPFEGTP